MYYSYTDLIHFVAISVGLFLVLILNSTYSTKGLIDFPTRDTAINKYIARYE